MPHDPFPQIGIDFHNVQTAKIKGGTLVSDRNLACIGTIDRDQFLNAMRDLWNVYLEYRVRLTLSFSRKLVFSEKINVFLRFPLFFSHFVKEILL